MQLSISCQWCTDVDRVALHGRHGPWLLQHVAQQRVDPQPAGMVLGMLFATHSCYCGALLAHSCCACSWWSRGSRGRTACSVTRSFTFFFQSTDSLYNSQLVRSYTSASSTCSPAWPPTKHACTCWHNQPLTNHLTGSQHALLNALATKVQACRQLHTNSRCFSFEACRPVGSHSSYCGCAAAPLVLSVPNDGGDIGSYLEID